MTNIKRAALATMAGAAVLVFFGAAGLLPHTANAQIATTTIGTSSATPTSTATTSSGTIYSTTSTTIVSSVTGASTTSATTTSTTVPAAISSTPVSSVTAQPIFVTSTSTTTTETPGESIGSVGEYLQIDGLMVGGVSGGTEPGQITATNPGSATCEQFATDNASTGTTVGCPVPQTSGISVTIDVNPSTQVLFNDRTPAALSDFVQGDTVNAYGYYSGNALEAEIVRDTSRTASGMTTTGAEAGSGTTLSGADTTAALQTELKQLEALVVQLESEVAATTTNTTSTTTSAAASGPMIPYVPSSMTSTLSTTTSGIIY